MKLAKLLPLSTSVVHSSLELLKYRDGCPPAAINTINTLTRHDPTR